MKYFLPFLLLTISGFAAEPPDELNETVKIMLKQVMALETEVRALRTANDELAAKIKELDKNQRDDLDVTTKQIDLILRHLKKLAAAPPTTPTDFKAREHVVQSGESLSAILEAYNAAFNDEGLSGHVTQSQVLMANPGLNPNSLLINQKILIPLPGEIKDGPVATNPRKSGPEAIKPEKLEPWPLAGLPHITEQHLKIARMFRKHQYDGKYVEQNVSTLSDFLTLLLKGQTHTACVLVLGKPNKVRDQRWYFYAVEIKDTLTGKKYHTIRLGFIGRQLVDVTLENDKID